MEEPIKKSARERTRPRAEVVEEKCDWSGFEMRLTTLEDKVEEVSGQMAEMRSLMFGDKNEVGILERLRSIENFMKGIKSLAWAVLVILLGLMVVQVYNIYVVEAAERLIH